MTTARENELLTRVGPGTPMGDLMRNYWLPVAKSEEVEADGPPLRLMALGEKLIAFRDSSGRVGVMDHRCPHRCGSLFFGRNEEDGIRCVYHGWKFDVDGNCLDMANVPPHQDFKHKVKAKAYPAIERFGAIWAYMGERDEAPPFPDYELNDLSDDEIVVGMIQQEYNWMQGLENDLDTSHFGFLHMGSVDPDIIDPNDLYRYVIGNRMPEYHIEDTPAGMMYGAYRPADPGTAYWRLAQFMVPFWVMPPAGNIENVITVKGYIPMDDTHTMTVTFSRKGARRASFPTKTGEPVPGLSDAKSLNMEFRENTTEWLGRWRLANSPENDYLIDRVAQRHGGVFSGIHGLAVQDNAIAGTMGPITDRTFEHLAASDAMITRARRILIRLVRAYQKDKSTPLPGVDHPEIYRGHRGGDFVAPEGQPFRDAYGEIIRANARTEPRWAAE